MADFLQSFAQGAQIGGAMRQAKQAYNDQQQLRTLAPQVIAGDVAATAQAQAIDPQAAQSYQAAGAGNIQRLKGAVGYFDKAKASGNPQAIQAAWQQTRPYWQQLAGNTPVPDQYDPSLDAGFEQLKAKIAAQGGNGLPAGQRVQSTYIDDQGNRVAVLSNGQTQVLGQNAANNQIIDTGDGYYGVNKGTLQATPVGTGGQAPSGGSPANSNVMRTSEGAMFDVSQVQDPNVRAQIMANPEAFGFIADSGGGSVSLPQASGQLRKAPEQITPYQQAQLAAGARDDSRADRLASLQEQSLIEGREAKQREAAAKAQTAQNAISTRQARLSDVQRSVQRLEGALNELDQSTLGTGPIAQYGQQYTEAGQRLNAVNSALNDSMLALVRVPGMGSQSDFEAKIAGMRYPQLGTNANVNRETLAQVKAFVNDLARESQGANQADQRDVQQGNQLQTASRVVDGPSSGRTVTRRGTLNGRKVVQYSDGTTEYAD